MMRRKSLYNRLCDKIYNELSENENVLNLSCPLSVKDWISVIDNEISENSAKRLLFLKISISTIILTLFAMLFANDMINFEIIETIIDFMLRSPILTCIVFLFYISISDEYFAAPERRRKKFKIIRRKIILGKLTNPNEIREEYLKVQDSELLNIFQKGRELYRFITWLITGIVCLIISETEKEKMDNLYLKMTKLLGNIKQNFNKKKEM